MDLSTFGAKLTSADAMCIARLARFEESVVEHIETSRRSGTVLVAELTRRHPDSVELARQLDGWLRHTSVARIDLADAFTRPFLEARGISVVLPVRTPAYNYGAARAPVAAVTPLVPATVYAVAAPGASPSSASACAPGADNGTLQDALVDFSLELTLDDVKVLLARSSIPGGECDRIARLPKNAGLELMCVLCQTRGTEKAAALFLRDNYTGTASTERLAKWL